VKFDKNWEKRKRTSLCFFFLSCLLKGMKSNQLVYLTFVILFVLSSWLTFSTSTTTSEHNFDFVSELRFSFLLRVLYPCLVSFFLSLPLFLSFSLLNIHTRQSSNKHLCLIVYRHQQHSGDMSQFSVLKRVEYARDKRKEKEKFGRKQNHNIH
jgi:hypothetical protein